MEASNLINEGLTLMIYGMGFVFVFLTLLVFATNFMSKLVTTFLPEAQPAAAKPMATAAVAPAGDAQLVAVISAAIKQHRAKHGARK